MRITDARSLPSNAQQDIREKAITAVQNGIRKGKVAELFGISRQALLNWINSHKEGGMRALRAKQRGRPRNPQIKSYHAAHIVRSIENKYPDQFAFPFFLWTREAVVMLIKLITQLQISVWTAGRYLKNWGFTPQKPVRRAFEQNTEAVKEWLEKEYPKIKKQAKQAKATIYWGDEMGLRSDHASGRTYGRKGHTPVVPGTGKRFGCNMISVINNRGKLHFMVFKKGFNNNVFIRFLKRVVLQIKRRVFLIIDSHPVHRSLAVKRWVFEHKKEIKIIFLPGYSPELNPDEMLNQDVKANASGRKRPRSQKEMMKNVRNYIRRRKNRPDLVKKYFQEEHVRYAAA